MAMKLFVVGGTWEVTQYGLCTDIVNRLNPGIEAVWVPYPACYGSKYNYRESYQIGRNNLRVAIDHQQEPFFVVGFSQGAKIAGDVTREHTFNPMFLQSYLIADPDRHIDDRLIGPKVQGHGVAGQRRVGPKAYQFALEGDIICANTNPVFSYIAASTASMSLHKPMTWLKSVGEASWRGGNPVSAMKQADRFLRSRVHIMYDTEVIENDLTTTGWIASDINHTLRS